MQGQTFCSLPFKTFTDHVFQAGNQDPSHIEYEGRMGTFFLLSSKHSLWKYDLANQAAMM